MKWLLLGYGDLSEKRVAKALQHAPNSELLAVWGRNEGKCRDFAKRHNIGQYFSGQDGLDVAMREDVDAVYVCTPVDTHFDYTIKSLNAGKHVLCEKPMAIDIKQCQTMIKCANENNLKLGIAYYRRCFPNIQRIKQLIDEEVLGKIIHVGMKFQEYYCPDENNQQYWRVLPEGAGGGVSYDVGSHRLDVLNFLFGRIKLIDSHKNNLVHDYPVEDTATFLMALEDFNQASAILNVSWACANHVDSLNITGSNAIVSVENLSAPEIKIISPDGIKKEILPKNENVHIPVIEDFIKAVSQGHAPICDGQEGLKTNTLLESIREAR